MGIRKATHEYLANLSHGSQMALNMNRVLDQTRVRKRVAAMGESDFWKLVDELGWGTRTTDYKALKNHILRKWGQEKTEAFSEAKDKLYNKLYKHLFNEVDGVGDDGFSDLLNHIIGLGKSEYDAVMKNPARAQARVDKRDYKESFSYAIPYKLDWEKLEQGIANLKLIDSALEQWEDGVDEEMYKPVQKEIQAIVEALRELKKTGDGQAYLDQYKTLADAAERVKRFKKKIQEDFENQLYAVGNMHHLLQNLASDVKELI